MTVVVVVGLDTERSTAVQQLLGATGWITVPLEKAVPSDQKQPVFLAQDQEVSPEFAKLLPDRDWQTDMTAEQIAETIKTKRAEGPVADKAKCAICGKPIEGEIVMSEKGAVHQECLDADKKKEDEPPADQQLPPADQQTPPIAPTEETIIDMKPEKPPKRFILDTLL